MKSMGNQCIQASNHLNIDSETSACKFAVSDVPNGRIWARTCLPKFEYLQVAYVVYVSRLLVVWDYPAFFREQNACPGMLEHALAGFCVIFVIDVEVLLMILWRLP